MSERLPTGHKQIDHLHMEAIRKQFPGVLAVDDVDFDVRSGEVHALLGENGAGKSTLMKILYGLYQPDGGTIRIDGRPVTIHSPTNAIHQGIGMIHQHFMLVPSLTVVENVALGLQSSRGFRLDLDVVAERLTELSQHYNLKVDPQAPIWQLAVGEQQRVEILRALYKGAALLILDEPTAVLTPQEVDDLFVTLRQMADDGHGLIFISHKLHEVLSLTQRITVLRDGRRVGTVPTSSATKPKLAEMMVGRPVVFQYDHPPVEPGEVRMALRAVSARSERGDLGLKGVSMDVRGGEIVGVAGVSGNGQHELAQVICGLRAIESGALTVGGDDMTGHSSGAIKSRGVSYIPEERMIDGIVKDFSVAENYALRDYDSAGFTQGGVFMNFTSIDRRCREAIQAYEIKTPGTTTKVKSLSGGNIQKLILARELDREPQIVIAAQPTRGVDIGAMEYIHHRLLDERARGTAVLLISEDLDEILLLADRVVVMFEGEIVGEVQRDEIVIEELGAMMAGTLRHSQ